MGFIRTFRSDVSNLTSYVDAGRDLLDHGHDLEAVWSHWRSLGCDWGDSIEATQQLTGMPHHEAKSAVYFSKSWSDMRPVIDDLHDTAEQAAREMMSEQQDSQHPKTAEAAKGRL